MFIVSDVIHMLCKTLDLSKDQEYKIEIRELGECKGHFTLSKKLILKDEPPYKIITREVINTFIEKYVGVYNALQEVSSIYQMGHSIVIGCKSIHIEIPATFTWMRLSSYCHGDTSDITKLEQSFVRLFENLEKEFAFVEITEDENCVLEYETFEIGVPDIMKEAVNGCGRVFQFPYIVIYDDHVRVNLMHKYIPFDTEKA